MEMEWSHPMKTCGSDYEDYPSEGKIYKFPFLFFVLFDTLVSVDHKEKMKDENLPRATPYFSPFSPRWKKFPHPTQMYGRKLSACSVEKDAKI